MRVLAVDDDPVTLTLLKGILTKGAMEVCLAGRGEEALALLQQGEVFDLLITDLNMPGVDGFHVLTTARAVQPLLPIVVLTSRDDREAVRRALQLGASDYLDKPVSSESLLGSIRRIMSSETRRQLERSAAVSRGLRAAQRELMFSSDIGRLCEGGAAAVFFRPLSEAGGDFIYARRRGEAEELIAVLDAVGHDIASSYNVAEYKGILEASLTPGMGIDQLLETLNRTVSGLGNIRRCCALGLLWNRDTGAFRMANAGIPYSWLLRSGTMRRIQINGAMLGLFHEAMFDVFEGVLHPGDRLLIQTDGFEEVTQGCPGWMAEWVRLAEVPLNEALEGLASFLGLDSGSVVLRDDILAVALEQLSKAPTGVQLPETALQIRSPSEFGQVESIVRRVLWFAHDFGAFRECERDDEMAIALRELILNAIQHGNRLVADKQVTTRVHLLPDERTIEVIVTDCGDGFDLSRRLAEMRDGDPLRSRGRGLLAVEAFSDDFQSQGNVVTARFQNGGAGH